MLPFPLHGVVGVRDMAAARARVFALRTRWRAARFQGRGFTPGLFVDGPGEADPARGRTAERAAGDRARPRHRAAR